MPRQRSKMTKVATGLAVGDYARILTSKMPVEIIEDRGYLGVGGRQIFRVRTRDPNLDEQSCYEVRAENLAPDPGAKVAP